MAYSITVPTNSKATVHLPGAKKNDISEYNEPLEKAEGVSKISQEIGKITLQVGSGAYEFRYNYI